MLRSTPPLPSISVPALMVMDCAAQRAADASSPANTGKPGFMESLLIPIARRLRSPRERFHDGSAANADAGVEQSVEEIVKHRVDHLLGQRRLVGEAKTRRKLLVDLEADRVRQRTPRAVTLVGELDGRLQHHAAGAVDVKLATGKPAQIRRIGGVEQQERRLTALRVQVEQHPPRLVLQPEFESGLARDVLDEFRVELEQQQLV